MLNPHFVEQWKHGKLLSFFSLECLKGDVMSRKDDKAYLLVEMIMLLQIGKLSLKTKQIRGKTVP